LIFSALAKGESHLKGLGRGEDVATTMHILRSLGVDIQESANTGEWRVLGRGPDALSEPGASIDCGNSGTSVRLLAGALATTNLRLKYVGDASLSRRPMARITEPLSAMGCETELSPGGGLPLTVRGPALRAVEWESSVASAQVKSCILLAGLRLEAATSFREPAPSRDHTETMLSALGADLSFGSGWARVRGASDFVLSAFDMEVPGDPSSAAFLGVAALLVEGSELCFQGVSLNPCRVAYLEVLREMGAGIESKLLMRRVGEAVGEIRVRPTGSLRGVEIEASRIPSVIDEIPVLAVAAAFAEGTTVFYGVEELRHKESDRVEGILSMLRQVGVEAICEKGRLVVHGGSSAHKRFSPKFAKLQANGDHRLAMASTILLACGEGGMVQGQEAMKVSYPEFLVDLDRLQGR